MAPTTTSPSRSRSRSCWRASARCFAAPARNRPPPTSIRIGDIDVDFKLHQARRGKERIEFTAREFDLLRYFVEHTGQVVTREQILNEVWGYEEFPTTRTIDNFVAKLRQKIETRAARPRAHPHDPRLRL